MKKIILMLLSAFLSACSSPPKPIPVHWHKATKEINNSMPRWVGNHGVILSPTVTGNWVVDWPDFAGDKGQYTPAFYYALAHAKRIIVKSKNADEGVNAKRWLQSHGARAVIEYQSKAACLLCKNTAIRFIHDNNRVAKSSEASQKVNPPVIKTVINKSVIKEKMKGDPLLQKTKADTPKPIVKPALPLWRAEVGSTLHNTLLKWSSKETCNSKEKWKIQWKSKKDYSIDSSLSFRGAYLDVTARI